MKQNVKPKNISIDATTTISKAIENCHLVVYNGTISRLLIMNGEIRFLQLSFKPDIQQNFNQHDTSGHQRCECQKKADAPGL